LINFRLGTTVLSCALLAVSALSAKADNLVLDGNFASDTAGTAVGNGPLSAGSPWTVTSVGASYGVYIVQGSCCNLGPADPLTVGSPDPGGANAIYFVTDNGTNTLSQTLSGFTSGLTYEVSFDAYLAFTGARNPFTPSFDVTLGGSSIADFPLTSLPIPASGTDPSAWTHFSETFVAPSTGSLDLDFSFITPGGEAKDILLDRVYVGAPVSSPTPEPGSLMLTGSGILSSLLMLRRRIR
jgi:hypothetical protein